MEFYFHLSLFTLSKFNGKCCIMGSGWNWKYCIIIAIQLIMNLSIVVCDDYDDVDDDDEGVEEYAVNCLTTTACCLNMVRSWVELSVRWLYYWKPAELIKINENVDMLSPPEARARRVDNQASNQTVERNMGEIRCLINLSDFIFH